MIDPAASPIHHRRVIYLDSNATSQTDPAVVDAMLPFLREHHANPSAACRSARLVRAALELARGQVAALLNAEPGEVIFTSGGTEADNAAIDSARQFWPQRNRLIIGATEHPAVIEPGARWAREGGAVTRIPVCADGIPDLDELKKAASLPDAALVSIMWANNETGVIAPIEEVVRIAHNAGIPVHTDAVQAFGKLHIDIRNTPVDYLSISGHKFHAPKGVGALFVSNRARFRPWVLGGGQESGRRSGTENVAAIVGMGVAAQIMKRQQESGVCSRIAAIRDEFETGILASLPQAVLNGSRTQRLGTTSSLCFPGLDAAGMLILLDEQGVCCSAGSACHAASVHPSPVLEAMGFDSAHAASTLRFSFSRFNTTEEVRAAAGIVIASARKLQQLKDEARGPVVISS